MNYVSNPRSASQYLTGRRQERARTIIFVAPPGSVPERLKQAVEAEFPWTVVEEVAHVDEAVRIYPNTVSLILIHPELMEAAERSTDDLFRFHPLALTAVLDCGTGVAAPAPGEIVASKLVRGVLPIQVRLEVSLSIVGLLLRGIEYYPRTMFSLLDTPAEKATAVATQPEPVTEGAVPSRLSVLTRRELQVLELVERGLQNKSIATSLNLSGHTVKIHLHNIISKLGAHNRTEAAAFYRGTITERVFH